jgi:hypothetical protein
LAVALLVVREPRPAAGFHQPLTAVIGQFVGMAVEEGGNLRLARK